MSTQSIDLILVGRPPAKPVEWTAGRVLQCEASPRGIADAVRAAQSGAGAYLFWDPALGVPSSEFAWELSRRRHQVVHAGLCLGMGSQPRAVDFVSPTWMLNADADASLESTSWRFSWRAAFVPAEILERYGGPATEFEDLAACGLEWGHRLVQSGVILRHTPRLLPRPCAEPTVSIGLRDEMGFLRMRMSNSWALYALTRMILSGFANPWALLAAWRTTRGCSNTGDGLKWAHTGSAPPPNPARVSVLIPTVDRYRYLRVILDQLQTQSVTPHEIIVVDQTHPGRRETDIATIRSRCPIRLLYLDKPGQCSARNAGLQIASGDFVLFVDDDDEIGPDLLERHLVSLASLEADVSAGVAEEEGAGPLPAHFRHQRVSDVFPTNNCMIRSAVLRGSGLFDLAYDKGARADGDLGMRVHKSGALMILNPDISVFHHHAPMGGLRTHKARKITYARSRTSIWHRHLPSPTECYLWKRYFSAVQVREETWLRVLGTLAVRGGMLRKLAKLAVSGLMLPLTLWRVRKSMEAAEVLRKSHPSIPPWAGGSPETPAPGTMR